MHGKLLEELVEELLENFEEMHQIIHLLRQGKEKQQVDEKNSTVTKTNCSACSTK